MLERIFSFFRGDEPRRQTAREDYALMAAKSQKKMAKEDHDEAVELIKLLEVENKLNNYAQLVESALKARRGSA